MFAIAVLFFAALKYLVLVVAGGVLIYAAVRLGTLAYYKSRTEYERYRIKNLG